LRYYAVRTPQEGNPKLLEDREASLPVNRPWRGLYAALATPLGAEGAPYLELLAARAAELLTQGCDGIALFGTTGEGPSFPVAERVAGLEALLAADIAPARLVVSTSAIAPGDALALTRHALSMGISDILLMPAFLQRAVDEDGLFRFYAEHIARAGSTRLRLLLYHIPQVSGIPLSPDLIERLATAFPDVVIGVKDSGADWPHTRRLLERFPALEILCGEESHLPLALALGGAGTICGLANVVPQLLRRLIASDEPEDSARLLALLQALGAAIERHATFAQGLRVLIAELTGEPAWLRTLPPLAPLAEAPRGALTAEFRELAAAIEAVLADPQAVVAGTR
jgi:4-hydroxy-tetrahydrodipicolinate synthase